MIAILEFSNDNVDGDKPNGLLEARESQILDPKARPENNPVPI